MIYDNRRGRKALWEIQTIFCLMNMQFIRISFTRIHALLLAIAIFNSIQLLTEFEDKRSLV